MRRSRVKADRTGTGQRRRFSAFACAVVAGSIGVLAALLAPTVAVAGPPAAQGWATWSGYAAGKAESASYTSLAAGGSSGKGRGGTAEAPRGAQRSSGSFPSVHSSVSRLDEPGDVAAAGSPTARPSPAHGDGLTPLVAGEYVCPYRVPAPTIAQGTTWLYTVTFRGEDECIPAFGQYLTGQAVLENAAGVVVAAGSSYAETLPSAPSAGSASTGTASSLPSGTYTVVYSMVDTAPYGWTYWPEECSVSGNTLTCHETYSFYLPPESPEAKAVPPSLATPHHSCEKDPVDCATGNFTETQTDFEIGGRGVGLDLTRTYNALAAATSSEPGAFGYGWTSSFEAHVFCKEKAASCEKEGEQITFTDGSGSTVPFTRAVHGWEAPTWSQDSLVGNSEVGYTLTLPDRTQDLFSNSGYLEEVIDRDGNDTKFLGGFGRITGIVDPSGRKMVLTYNAEGLIEKATDPMGHEVRYTYEGKNLKSVTLPGETSPAWQFSYDGSHRLTKVIDGRGGETTNQYDASNRVVSQTDPAGRTTTWSYSEPSHTRITDKATGAVTDEWFNTYHQPLKITRGFGTASASTEEFGYEGGLLTSKTDGAGHTWTYGYDAAGDRTSERDPDGDETTWTFDPLHQLVSARPPEGRLTWIERNAHGDVINVSREQPEGTYQETNYTYGPHGEMTSMTNPLEFTWTYGYDTHGDKVSETDPEGDKRTWGYDEDSRVTSTVSPRGNAEGAKPAEFETRTERDAQGRPVKVTDPLGHVTEYAYDADGNLASETDPIGHRTKFTYDADDEQTKVEEPDGATQETGYDGAGQVVSQTDGKKQVTTYVRNVLEQPVEVIDPLGRKTIETYDGAWNLKTRKDADGRTTTYTYDPANRLTGIAYSDGVTHGVTFGRDRDGRVTSMVDGSGTSTFEYDDLDRLVRSVNGAGETVRYHYNHAEELNGIVYPNGRELNLGYDEAGRLRGLNDWLGNQTSFAYDRDSDLTSTTFPPATGDKDEYTYDRDDRMSGVAMKKSAETLASLGYTRNKAGQVESLVSKGLPGAEIEAFAYDEDGRLASAGTAGYGYDAADEMTKAPGTTNAFDKASELESATGATFVYDKEGERTKRTPSSGAATTYRYDQAGDLAAIERAAEGATPAIAESFAYDGTGLVTARTVGAGNHHLAWDLSPGLPLLLSDGEDSYVYGPGGLPVEQISAGEVPTYLHHDQLGSTRLLTNSEGKTAATFSYSSYGALEGHTGTATTPLGFAGQYTLGQSGLQYLRARFYDPATGQFVTRDPAVEETREPYGYAADDPTTFVDPSGEDIFGDVVGAVDGGCALTAEIPGVDLATCGAAAAVTAGAATVAIVEAVSGEGEGEVGGEPVAEDCSSGTDTTPAGRPFSNHYLDETGPERNIPGSVVDEAIDHGEVVDDLPDRTVYYDPENDVTVVESKTTGKIMSAHRGAP